MTESLSNTGSTAELTVSEENITFAAGSESETVVKNLSNVSEITIKETEAGQFTIRTTEDQPLTDDEREQARTIAVTNETVAQALDGMDEYELSVEPVQQLNASASDQRSFDVVTQPNGTNGELAIRDNTTNDQGDGLVTIERDSNYVEDRAVVHVRQSGATDRHNLKYTVDVDLANSTVTGVTDWENVRQDSATVDVTGKLNTTEIVDRTS
ncbi:hypothetical protein C481_03677 [Natrialba asiatica DSM 12278]|uniref:Uncharacterized protein n=1 Tax=Natrialba asiatica (strain ATCC 700177 / DSM 12278 / JCM 9576 / FERM P-10747 / NBRC 102637 / 172P1) TaxID=29540 RepID=M0B3M7_NATA1|nr:hypothetical protein C481_03677 [Natrialba asiatica DSM 12278]